MCMCTASHTHTPVEAQGHHGYLPSFFPSYLLRQRLSLNLGLTFGILVSLLPSTGITRPASHLGAGEYQLKSSSLHGKQFTQGASFPAPRVKPNEKAVLTARGTEKSFLVFKETSQVGLRVETKKTAKK